MCGDWSVLLEEAKLRRVMKSTPRGDRADSAETSATKDASASSTGADSQRSEGGQAGDQASGAGSGGAFSSGKRSHGRRFGTSPRPPRSLGSLLWLLVYLAVGITLCFVPLFNLLGYESALVLSVLASLSGVRQGIRSVHRARLQLRAADSERFDLAPLRTVLKLYGRALVAGLLLLLIPLVLLLASGLRVRNCNYLSGLGFFVMMPMCSAATATAVGLAAALLTRRARFAFLAAYGVLLLSLLWAVWRMVGSPAIFAYDPFFGYFPGAIYDEDVALTSAFYAARGMHFLLALATLFVVAQGLDGQSLTARLRPAVGHGRGRTATDRRRRGGLRLLALLTLTGGLSIYYRGGALGLYTDVPALESFLTGELVTEHFVLRYRPGGPVERDLLLYQREHELRYRQLRDLLQVEPTWQVSWPARLLRLESHSQPGWKPSGPPPKLVSYLFDSMEQKRRWMGAANVFVAKPWRREIYLHHESWPHPVLRHELAHIFAGAAGDRVMRVTMLGLIPQPGLIEGLAVAADWRASGTTPHQSVRTLRDSHLEPPLTQVFGGLQFWRLPGGRAYTVAGSFCRYLLTTFGPQPLLRVYHDGGRPSDFARAYGQPFAQLVAAWSAQIDAVPMQPAAQAVEQERLRRPAVFHKVCAHELALRKQRARQAVGQGDYAEAVRLMASVCSDDPAEPAHQAELMELLWAAGRYPETEKVAQAILVHPQRTSVLRAWALARLGDLAVVQGERETATSYYNQAAALPLDENSLRQLLAKQAALADPDAGTLLLRVLLGVPTLAQPGQPPPLVRDRASDRQPEALTAYTLTQAIARSQKPGLPRYMLGRLLHQRGGYLEAAEELSQSLTLGLPDRAFRLQALLLLGQAQLLSGQLTAATASFTQLRTELAPHEQGRALECDDYLDRIARWPTLLAAP